MKSCRRESVKRAIENLPRAALALLLASGLFAPLAAAEEAPDAWKSFGEKLVSTTAFPLGSEEARAQGFWHGAWDGSKRIWTEGSQDFYASGYFYHAPYGYSSRKRDEFNDNAWGVGYGRTVTEDNQNQRMFLGMIARDSYWKPLYIAGYVWLARWDIGGNVRVGAGYSALIVAHSTATNYWPVPALVPVVSIGTNHAALYATYLNAVGYFFAKFSFDR